MIFFVRSTDQEYIINWCAICVVLCAYFAFDLDAVLGGARPGMLCCCCCALLAFLSLLVCRGAIASDSRCSSAVFICCASSVFLKYAVSLSSVAVENDLSASLLSGCLSG